MVRIALADPGLIGQEFFRWEIATAMAGAIIGIDPFDQPDVEAAKVKTRQLVEAYERTGRLDPARAGAARWAAQLLRGPGSLATRLRS